MMLMIYINSFHGLFSGENIPGGKGRRAAESLRLSVYLIKIKEGGFNG